MVSSKMRSNKSVAAFLHLLNWQGRIKKWDANICDSDADLLMALKNIPN